MTSMFLTARMAPDAAAGAAAGRVSTEDAAALISAALARCDVVFLGELARRVFDHRADGLRVVRGDPLRHDLELGAVPLHHPPAFGTIVLRTRQLERRDHAV